MGFFDFITKADKMKEIKDKEPQVSGDKKNYGVSDNIEQFSPVSFDDVAAIIDVLCQGRPVIVHLSEVKDNTAQRVLDLLSGAVYAISGNVGKLEKDIYLFTPNGQKIR